jgi:hypothetical protein
MPILPSPIGRHCLTCLADLSDTMGCYVFIRGGKMPPHDVITCLNCGQVQTFTQETYDRLLADAIEYLASSHIQPGERVKCALCAATGVMVRRSPNPGMIVVRFDSGAEGDAPEGVFKRAGQEDPPLPGSNWR